MLELLQGLHLVPGPERLEAGHGRSGCGVAAWGTPGLAEAAGGQQERELGVDQQLPLHQLAGAALGWVVGEAVDAAARAVEAA